MSGAGPLVTGPGPAHRLDRGSMLLAGAVAALALAVVAPALAGLTGLFRRVEFYGHGYLVPAVAAYLAFSARHRIRKAFAALEPPRFGWLVALGAGLFQALMIVGDVGFAAGLGIPLVLGAAAFSIGGRRLVRPLVLPLAFLALMVPPPRFVLYELLPRLKLLVTQASVWILRSVGATVLGEGNQIEIPGHTLFVSDACSGLTSIVTMLPIACVLAWFLTRGVWRRAVVVASVVPLAMIANIVRILVTVQLVSSVGIEAAQGLLHESFGVATYAIGTLALVALARCLR
jgi:exosortase